MNQKITPKKLAISMAILAAVFVFASCSKQQPKPQDNQKNYIQNQNQNNQQQNTDQGDNNQQAPDSYERWHTYKNEGAGFEFKYPENLQENEIQSKSALLSVSSPERDLLVSEGKTDLVGGVNVKIKNEKFDKNNISDVYGKIPVEKITEATNQNGVGYFKYTKGDAGCVSRLVNIPSGNKTILLTIHNDCSGSLDFLNLHEQRIIDSFLMYK